MGAEAGDHEFLTRIDRYLYDLKCPQNRKGISGGN
jgi:hypothetical protein